jgi:hypothetical protein
MPKSIVVLTLATCVMACSQQPPAQSGAASPAAAPAPAASQAPPDAAKPAPPEATGAPPAGSAPASSPAAAASTPAATAPAAATPASTPAAAAPAAAAPTRTEPPPPPAPTFREVTIPAGTSLSVKVLDNLASNTSKVEDAVKGSIAKAVVADGTTALPVGTQILGSVIGAAESGRVKGRASIAFRFDRLVFDGETIRIHTASVQREAAKDTKSDVKKGGLGAGAGAIVGGIIGGGKGAAIGAVAGGTGAVLATKGSEVEVPSGTVVSVLVQDPITLRVQLR